MTDKDIIKALECCCSETTENTCDNCPLFNISRPDCYRLLANKSLDLINRQQEKNKELKKEKYRLQKALNQAEDYRLIARAEAIKEFAERLNDRVFQKRFDTFYGYIEIMGVGSIDSLVKEMVGEQE